MCVFKKSDENLQAEKSSNIYDWLTGRAERRIPSLQDGVLIGDRENMFGVEKDLQCSTGRHSEKDEQLQTIDDRGDVFPIVSNLKENVANEDARKSFYLLVVAGWSHMIGNETEIFRCFVGFFRDE